MSLSIHYWENHSLSSFMKKNIILIPFTLLLICIWFFRCKVDVIIIVRSIRSNSVLLIQLQFNSVELRARFWIAWFSGFLNWPLGHAVILEQQQYTKSFLNLIDGIYQKIIETVNIWVENMTFYIWQFIDFLNSYYYY